MEYTLNRSSALGKRPESIPRHTALLTATPKRQPPVAGDLFSNLPMLHPLLGTATRDRVVVEVALNDRSEPLAGLLNRIVLAGEE